MLYRKIGLVGPKSHRATGVPSSRKAWVECEGAIDQSNHGTDVLTEITEGESRIRENGGIIIGHSARPSPALQTLTTVHIVIVGPPKNIAVHVKSRGQCEGWPKIGVALYHPVEEVPEFSDPSCRR